MRGSGLRYTFGRACRRAAGFTLLELLIAMAIMVLIMVGILDLFDRLNRLSRVQLNLTEMQQSLRVSQRELVRMTRMVGRGGLDGLRTVNGTVMTDGRILRGPAVEVRNNMPAPAANRRAVQGQAATQAIQGTDVLIFRGVFTTPLYLVDILDPNTVTLNPPDVDGRTGTVRIDALTPTLIRQDFAPLIEAITSNVPEALLLIDAWNPSTYGVAQLNPATSVVAADSITIGFTTKDSDGDAKFYKSLSWDNGVATFPTFPRGIGFVGMLEEYRYYIREEYAVSGDATTELLPRLSYARVFPATETAYRGDLNNLRIDIADYIFDLQVALGFDSSADGVADGKVTESATGADDDWLFNVADDQTKLGAAPWNTSMPLLNARITTMTRSAAPDPGFENHQPLAGLEDHDYSAGSPYAYNLVNGTTIGPDGLTVDARKYRRQILQTVVDFRNVR